VSWTVLGEFAEDSAASKIPQLKHDNTREPERECARLMVVYLVPSGARRLRPLMNTYYFVAFESRSKPDALVRTVSNVILKDVHPVIWLANPPEAYGEYWVGYLLFWSEISEEVAMEGAKYTPIEGPNETFSVREGMAKAFDLV
jgi:hypothetical protein